MKSLKDSKFVLYGLARMLTDLDTDECQKLVAGICEEETPLLKGVKTQKRKTGATLEPEILIKHLADYFLPRDEIVKREDRDKYRIFGAPQFFEKTGFVVGYEYMTPNQLSRALARLARVEPDLAYYSGVDRSPPYYYELNIPAIIEKAGHFVPPLKKYVEPKTKGRPGYDLKETLDTQNFEIMSQQTLLNRRGARHLGLDVPEWDRSATGEAMQAQLFPGFCAKACEESEWFHDDVVNVMGLDTDGNPLGTES